MSVRGGEVADAYYIVNSLQSSIQPDPKPLHAIPVVRSLPHRPFLPLDFGRPISPRLGSHALLHSLLCVGLTQKAYKLTEEMMESGIKVHPKSLDAVMRGLLLEGTTAPGPIVSRRLAHVTNIHLIEKALEFHSRLAADQSTRFAVRLILRARHHRQRCTAEAYYSIISYCIKRGEILIASLLLYALLCDYQLKQTMAARLRGQIQSVDTDGCEVSATERKAALQCRLKDVIWQKGVLDKNTIFALVTSIQQSLLQDPQPETDDNYVHVSLQALANVAMLLDERRIPFPEVTAIIRALSLCPRTHAKVWIVRNGKPVCVEAYSYFHDVLYRLARDPPSIKFPRRLGRLDEDPKSSLPPLDLTAYNTLLHYALRHRLDLTLADSLLRHMRKLPKPLEPDIVTYNIILRASTLLRRSDIAENTLIALRRSAKNAQHGIMVTENSHDTLGQARSVDYVDPSLSGMPLFRTDFSKVLRRLQREKLVLPSVPPNRLTADGYTLSSYILHLTSTGRPHIVADILFHVLPELDIVDHPSWGSMSKNECMAWRKMRIKSRRERIHRAASLGPDFFVAVLNALCKAGKTGLAERVWLLAKQAERVSWLAGDIPPWFLPVHAYTIMMQCYTDEAHKGLTMGQAGHGRMHKDQYQEWVPLCKENIRGWAKFIVSSQSSRDIPRRYAARVMGKQLFGSMINGGRGVFQSLIQLKNQGHSNISVPQPDARFFNATIALFTCSPFMKARVRRSGFKRKWRMIHLRYARTGALSRRWHPIIQTIAEQMVEHGYSVPPGLRALLIGRSTVGVMSGNDRQRLDMRPFAFPQRVHDTFRPYRVSTVNERGLPIRGRRRKRRHSHTGHERTNIDTTENILTIHND